MISIVLGNLPEGVDEKEIREILQKFSGISKIVCLKNQDVEHSPYEYLVTLDIDDRIDACIITNRLSHYCWKGRMIHAHVLLF